MSLALPLLRRGRALHHEMWMRHHSGSSLWVQIIAYAADTRDLGAGTWWLVQDRTDFRRTQDELHANLARIRETNQKLEEAQNQLLQQDKMASIGQLAAGVAHEINNPVGFVSSNLHTLRQYVQTLLALADRLDMTLVEDAAYRELRFIGEATPTVLSLDIARSGGIDNARTMFLGTLSKTLSPALRIGWVCGPKAVIEKLVLLKQGADLHVSTINQMVAHRAVSEGYDQHLHRLRGAYGHKARVMLAALDKTMPKGVTWSHPEGGMFVWIDLPEGIDGAALLARAIAEERVAFVPGAPFYANHPDPATLRLSFATVGLDKIEEGVGRLGLAL